MSASISYDGPEGIVFESRRKARKRHACDVCPEPIEPGETYVAIWAPEWFTAALHAGCYDLIQRLRDELELEDDEGIEYHEVAEHAAEQGYTFDAPTRTWSKA